MNAAEIIVRFETLPKEEQEKVLAFLTERFGGSDKRAFRYVDEKSFGESMEYVFKNFDGLLRRLAK